MLEFVGLWARSADELGAIEVLLINQLIDYTIIKSIWASRQIRDSRLVFICILLYITIYTTACIIKPKLYMSVVKSRPDSQSDLTKHYDRMTQLTMNLEEQNKYTSNKIYKSPAKSRYFIKIKLGNYKSPKK